MAAYSHHAATRSLLERSDAIIVASVSCIYGIGAVETYSAMVLTLAVGQKIERDALLKRLVELEYRRNDHDFTRGAFRVRGDVIEIFPSHMEDRAWRISLLLLNQFTMLLLIRIRVVPITARIRKTVPTASKVFGW